DASPYVDASPYQDADPAAHSGVEPRRLLAEGSADGLLELLGVDAAVLEQADGQLAASLTAFWQAMLTGLAAHRPSRFAGPVHLVVSSRGTEETRAAVIQGWRRLARRLVVSYADGDHYQLMREPWVATVADAFADPDSRQA